MMPDRNLLSLKTEAVALLVLGLVAATVAIPSFSRVTQRTACRANIRHIVMATTTTVARAEIGTRFPASAVRERLSTLDGGPVLRCPANSSGSGDDYQIIVDADGTCSCVCQFVADHN
jgi:hypothetical protein